MLNFVWGECGGARFIRWALVTVLCGTGMHAFAQQQTAPKWELYGGYSVFDAGAAVYGLLPGGVTPVQACLCWDPKGAGASVTYDFTRWFGITGDMSGHWGKDNSTLTAQLEHSAFYNLSGGPKFTYRAHHFSPFVEALMGENRLAPELFHHDDEFGLLAGGGVDLTFKKHFAIRLVRADYVYSNHQFGPSATVPQTQIRGVRLQSGVVFLFGGKSPVIVPAPVVPPPAPVPVPVEVISPPSVTCSASPMTVTAGDTSLITSVGVSPQNRPLTYSYNATAGSISGTESTATLQTAGAAAGAISVTCVVVDDKGQTASQATSVMVVTPVVVKPVTADLCSVEFGRDKRRPARVDNEAKACLDEVALSLQRSADAMLAIVGHSSGEPKLASQRAVNTKAYLVSEKGIDASRISVYAGSPGADGVSNILVPAGATLDSAGDTPVDQDAVKAVPRTAHPPK